MAAKYHVGKNGAGLCHATKRKCPLGGASGEEHHYATLEEAEAEFAARQGAEKKLSKGGRGKSKSESREAEGAPKQEQALLDDYEAKLRADEAARLARAQERLGPNSEKQYRDRASDLREAVKDWRANRSQGETDQARAYWEEFGAKNQFQALLMASALEREADRLGL